MQFSLLENYLFNIENPVWIEHYDLGYHILWSYHKLGVRKGKKISRDSVRPIVWRNFHILYRKWTGKIIPSVRPTVQTNLQKPIYRVFLIVYHQGNDDLKRGGGGVFMSVKGWERDKNLLNEPNSETDFISFYTVGPSI